MTKRQHEYAKEKGFKWIYVNHYNYVMGSKKKPRVITFESNFGSLIKWEPDGKKIGGYQGELWWTNTLEKVV